MTTKSILLQHRRFYCICYFFSLGARTPKKGNFCIFPLPTFTIGVYSNGFSRLFKSRTAGGDSRFRQHCSCRPYTPLPPLLPHWILDLGGSTSVFLLRQCPQLSERFHPLDGPIHSARKRTYTHNIWCEEQVDLLLTIFLLFLFPQFPCFRSDGQSGIFRSFTITQIFRCLFTFASGPPARA